MQALHQNERIWLLVLLQITCSSNTDLVTCTPHIWLNCRVFVTGTRKYGKQTKPKCPFLATRIMHYHFSDLHTGVWKNKGPTHLKCKLPWNKMRECYQMTTSLSYLFEQTMVLLIHNIKEVRKGNITIC